MLTQVLFPTGIVYVCCEKMFVPVAFSAIDAYECIPSNTSAKFCVDRCVLPGFSHPEIVEAYICMQQNLIRLEKEIWVVDTLPDLEEFCSTTFVKIVKPHMYYT